MKTEKITEENKLIAEFNRHGYEVFTSGKVKGVRGKWLKLHKGTSGYLQVNVWNNYKQRTFLLHRLLAEAFIPNPNNLSEVNHKDGNKLNNSLDNLEWVSRSENIRHGIDTGLIPSPWQGKTGKAHNRSKPVIQLKDGIVIAEYGSAREAARKTNICYGTISNVLINKGKSAGGFLWKYKE